MEKSKKENQLKRAEHGISTFREMVMSLIPFGQVVDSFLNYRAKLKQKRLEKFLEDVRSVFEDELGKDLSKYNFETEDFVDVLDSVVQKVVLTKSEYKLRRFRNILLNQMIEPMDNLIVEKYLQLLDDINEIQLIILACLPTETGMFHEEVTDPTNFLLREGKFKFSDSTNRKSIDFFISNIIVKIQIDDIDFYVNDLVSKGFIDKTLKLPEQTGVRTPTLSEFSNFSKNLPVYKYVQSKTSVNFLEFLELYEDK